MGKFVEKSIKKMELKCNKSDFNFVLIVIVASLLFLGTHIFGSLNNMLALTFVVWFVIIAYCVKDVDRKIGLLLFLVSFFNFLLGRLANDFLNFSFIDYHGKVFEFGKETKSFMYTALYVSIVSIFFSFVISSNKIRNIYIQTGRRETENTRIQKVQKISKLICYITCIFSFLKTYELANQVWTSGYMSLYTERSRSFPELVYKFADIFELVIFIFLATLPTKRESYPILIIYGLLGVLALMTGVRGNFVVVFLFIIFYLFLRNQTDIDEIWIGKKGKIILIAAAPVLVCLMFIVMAVRIDSKVDNLNLGYLLANHFYQQGGSVQIIGLAYDTTFPQDQFYSIGTLIRKIQSSIFVLPFSANRTYEYQSIDMAMNGHQLGSYLTYYYQPRRYLDGGNMATSYVAEAWLDGGFCGIIFWSSMWGFIIANINKWVRSNVWLTALSFYALTSIFKVPRAGCTDFIAELISPMYMIVVFFIYWYSSSNPRLKK